MNKEEKVVGSMYVEVNKDGYHGVVEVAMVELPSGEISPGGVRDALTRERPEVLPQWESVKAAIELAKWCYANQSIFEGRVSKNKCDPTTDCEPNRFLEDDDV